MSAPRCDRTPSLLARLGEEGPLASADSSHLRQCDECLDRLALAAGARPSRSRLAGRNTLVAALLASVVGLVAGIGVGTFRPSPEGDRLAKMVEHLHTDVEAISEHLEKSPVHAKPADLENLVLRCMPLARGAASGAALSDFQAAAGPRQAEAPGGTPTGDQLRIACSILGLDTERLSAAERTAVQTALWNAKALTAEQYGQLCKLLPRRP